MSLYTGTIEAPIKENTKAQKLKDYLSKTMQDDPNYSPQTTFDELDFQGVADLPVVKMLITITAPDISKTGNLGKGMLSLFLAGLQSGYEFAMAQKGEEE